MGSWNRRNQINSEDHYDYKDLLVFGYPSTIFPNDYQSEHIAEERHMVPCLGDVENRVDSGSSRALEQLNNSNGTVLKWYDCRLLLPTIDVAITRSGETQEQCPTEAMEEDMCEEERYRDMHKDIQKEQEENEKRKKESRSAIGFNYGTGTVKEPESDSEDEPFEVPEGVKFPVGLELPPNMKLHHIIEKTASFIVANGTQMEIVIKAKQRNNAEQFGFLEFDHRLNPFYKYLQKLIREKKYIPDLSKRPKKLTKAASPVSKKSVISSSLAAIAAAHGSDSDDSDSDCELHPSLLSGGIKRTEETPEKPGTIGPRKKPIEQYKPPEMHLKPSGDISQRNDVYAALFKNLAHVTRQAAGVEETKHGLEEKTPKEEKDDSSERLEDPEYREWYEMFYGKPCPWVGPRPLIPPTPDLEPILNSYSEIVARKGAEIEESLVSRPELQLHFMDPKSPYYSYYHHKVRIHQWNMYHAQEQASYPSPLILGSPVPLMSSDLLPPIPSTVSSPGPSSLMNLNISTPPEPPMNRRQRRKLLESSRLDDSITEPGIFDPINVLPKSASTPANLQSLDDSLNKSISFTIRGDGSKEDSSFRYDPDVEDVETAGPSDSTFNYSDISGLFPPPPTPPILPNTIQTQVDRKEKARIFMEKLLLEKKAKKQQEDEDRLKLEEETKRKAEKISESLSGKKNERRKAEDKQKEVVPKTLDDIITSKIDSLLAESGLHPVKEIKQDKEEEDNHKKSRKRSRSRRRSRSRSPRTRDRSRSRSRDSKKSRKSGRYRSRSRSHSRDRHRRYRSRSRERSYRR